MVHVIGSGPAGIACAAALLDQGVEVTLIDAGVSLEPEMSRKLEPLRSQLPAQWDSATLAEIRNRTSAQVSGVPLKYIFGSDYPYQGISTFTPVRCERVECSPSLARGGLSNVWGAAMLPYRDSDIRDWPIRSRDLAPHYEAILRMIPYSAHRDGLEELYPLYSSSVRAVRSSKQALDWKCDLEKNQEVLRSQGFRFGSSRLAVEAGDPRAAEKSGCLYCGMCMYGCPHDRIYSAAHTLEKWVREKRPGFHYQSNVVVERLRENGSAVRILGRDRLTRKNVQIDSERVFLACGALGSTRILLESLEAYDREVTLQDSQYFIFPMLRYRATKGVESENLHTLSQLFLEILDEEISQKTLHIQLYSYTDLYTRALKSLLGVTHPLFAPFLSMFMSRLWVAQGYLHSELSPSIRLRLSRGTEDSPGALTLMGGENPKAKAAVKAIVRKLAKNHRRLGAMPVVPMVKPGLPGKGNHFGGSFPMREHPKEFETDRWGRIAGFSRVHVADSTTFPSIPATTITLTTMANAHRIGSAIREISHGS
jgi:choline dehydrogenase-like flavoprotein